MRTVTLLVLLVGAVLANDFPYSYYEWENMEYAWEPAFREQDAIRQGWYIKGNNIPLGAVRWKTKLFMATPRFKIGTAATLSYIYLTDENKPGSSPALVPYQGWIAHLLPQYKSGYTGIQFYSVTKIWVDSSGNLWVIDEAIQGSREVGTRVQLAEPRLMIFNLTSDELIREYTFKKSDYVSCVSTFRHIVLDERGCGDVTAYIADATGFGIIGYSFKENRSWRITHNYFYPDPFEGLFNLNGFDYIWPGGIYGLSLSAIQADGNRTAYFHPAASTKEFGVSTHVLEKPAVAHGVEEYPYFKLIGDRGANSKSYPSAMDEDAGILYFSEIPKFALSCWNTKLPLNPGNVKQIVSYPGLVIEDCTIDHDNNMWCLQSDVAKFVYNQQKSGEINYRILKISLEDARKPCALGCQCDPCECDPCECGKS